MVITTKYVYLIFEFRLLHIINYKKIVLILTNIIIFGLLYYFKHTLYVHAVHGIGYFQLKHIIIILIR